MSKDIIEKTQRIS